jgi:hypothetical protein
MYTFKETNAKDSYKIWKQSPNASIYTNPEFLSNLKNIKYYSVYNGEEPLCCWPVHLSENEHLNIPDFFYYFGPFWSKIILETPNHSWLSKSSKVYECFLETLTKKYKKINFQFHYSLSDVRIFDWWNYNTKKNKFDIKVKYTALINQLKIKNEKEILSNYRYVRRYEIKNFKENESKIYLSDEISVDELIKIYFDTIKEKYSKKYEQSLIEKLIFLHNMCEKKFGKIYAYREKKSNKLICLILILLDKNSAHLVLNLSTKDWKSENIMSWAIHKLILSVKSLDIDVLDFNGANSPKLGDDKQSYGCMTKTYFDFYF